MRTILTPILLLLFFSVGVIANASDALVQEGKKAIENGRYEEAVNDVGQILDKSDNVSRDPEVLSLHKAIQAYGMIRLNDHGYDKEIEQNLTGAISLDPNWEYPKKLLEEFRISKDHKI